MSYQQQPYQESYQQPSQGYQQAPQGYQQPPQGYQPQAQPAGGYPGAQYQQQSGPMPEWRRIMVEDLFTFNLPCIAGFFFPNIVGAITMYKLRGTCDAIITCCCFPFVCCCNRTAVKSAVGLDITNDSCLANCFLHWFCHCFAVAQEYNAINSLQQYIAMYGPGAVPGAPVMHTM